MLRRPSKEPSESVRSCRNENQINHRPADDAGQHACARRPFKIQRVESKRVDEFENMSDEELRQYVYGNKELDS